VEQILLRVISTLGVGVQGHSKEKKIKNAVEGQLASTKRGQSPALWKPTFHEDSIWTNVFLCRWTPLRSRQAGS